MGAGHTGRPKWQLVVWKDRKNTQWKIVSNEHRKIMEPGHGEEGSSFMEEFASSREQREGQESVFYRWSDAQTRWALEKITLPEGGDRRDPSISSQWREDGRERMATWIECSICYKRSWQTEKCVWYETNVNLGNGNILYLEWEVVT